MQTTQRACSRKLRFGLGLAALGLAAALPHSARAQLTTSTGATVADAYQVHESSTYDFAGPGSTGNTFSNGSETVGANHPLGNSYYNEQRTYAPTLIGTASDANSVGSHVIIFTESGTDFTGLDFAATFLPSTVYTEDEVAAYIASGFTDTNTTDASAYNTFLDHLRGYDGYDSDVPPATETVYEFSNGQPIGTIPVQGTGGPYGYYGFGLAPNAPTTAAPEPSSVAAFAFTGLGAAGLILRARKRRAA